MSRGDLTEAEWLILKDLLPIERIDVDHYGRTIALVSGADCNLSYWQLEQGQAIYKRAWDNGERVAAICPTSVLRNSR